MSDETTPPWEDETPEPAPKKRARTKRQTCFDPDKSFATVHGAGPAIYFQGGKYYNAGGKEVEGPK